MYNLKFIMTSNRTKFLISGIFLLYKETLIKHFKMYENW